MDILKLCPEGQVISLLDKIPIDISFVHTTRKAGKM
jgi:hypothetical protein